MLPEQLRQTLGHGGSVAVLAFVVGAIVRLLKTDRVAIVLAQFGLPPVPKVLLPWLSIGFGTLGMALDALVSGAKPLDAAVSALWGVLSGALAVAGNETVVNTARALRAPVAPSGPAPAAGGA